MEILITGSCYYKIGYWYFLFRSSQSPELWPVKGNMFAPCYISRKYNSCYVGSLPNPSVNYVMLNVYVHRIGLKLKRSNSFFTTLLRKDHPITASCIFINWLMLLKPPWCDVCWHKHHHRFVPQRHQLAQRLETYLLAETIFMVLVIFWMFLIDFSRICTCFKITIVGIQQLQEPWLFIYKNIVAFLRTSSSTMSNYTSVLPKIHY